MKVGYFIRCRGMFPRFAAILVCLSCVVYTKLQLELESMILLLVVRALDVFFCVLCLLSVYFSVPDPVCMCDPLCFVLRCGIICSITRVVEISFPFPFSLSSL